MEFKMSLGGAVVQHPFLTTLVNRGMTKRSNARFVGEIVPNSNFWIRARS